MVDALVSFVLEKIVNTAREEAVFLSRFREEIEILTNKLLAIRGVLQDASMRQINDEAVKRWLLKLKDAAYQLEDFLEDWSMASYSIVRNSIPPFSCAKHIIIRHRFKHRITNLKQALNQIAEEKDRYQFREINAAEVRGGTRSTYSHIDASSVYGRVEDQEILVAKLVEKLNCDNYGHIPLISIVGMGGVGKTTLAQTLFNAQIVKSHFENRWWVCVSDKFDAQLIMKNIVEVGGGDCSGLTTLELTQQTLARMLGRKKYLLVLDDVWNEDYMKWEQLKNILDCGHRNDSRIIVTTRKAKVAETVGSAYTHQLRELSKDDCWLIFKKIAIEGRGVITQEFSGMEDIGQKIVDKCKGIPLAVKTLASVVRCKKEKESWEDVLSNEIWSLTQSDEDIIPALWLSYNELPPPLRQCFGFCSLFPKNVKLRRETLIRMWVAEGYIMNDGERDLEDIGKSYFNELLGRSFFQELEKDELGNVITCQMHDLIHELGQYATSGEFSLIDQRKVPSNVGSFIRHCFLYVDKDKRCNTLDGVKSLRTLIVGGHANHFSLNMLRQLPKLRVLSIYSNYLSQLDVSNEVLELIIKLVHLRYLGLTWSKIESLPKSILNLQQLRYLNLSCSSIRTLPEALTCLYHLETLNLSSCKKLEKLPEGINKLRSLRIMNITETHSLKSLPLGVGSMTFLRTLGKFPISEEAESIKMLRDLNNLRGKLLIDNLRRVESKEQSCSANLKGKRHVSSLSFLWVGESEKYKLIAFQEEGKSRGESVAEGLQPPPSLVNLEIYEYPGGTFPNWLVSLSSLTSLKLWRCNNCTKLPPLGLLPQLKRLHIFFLPGVTHVGGEFFGDMPLGFQQLEVLILRSLVNWEAWKPLMITDENGEEVAATMPHLHTLSVSDCPKLGSLPHIFTSSLRHVKINHCPELEQRCNLSGDLCTAIAHSPSIV